MISAFGVEHGETISKLGASSYTKDGKYMVSDRVSRGMKPGISGAAKDQVKRQNRNKTLKAAAGAGALAGAAGLVLAGPKAAAVGAALGGGAFGVAGHRSGKKRLNRLSQPHSTETWEHKTYDKPGGKLLDTKRESY